MFLENDCVKYKLMAKDEDGNKARELITIKKKKCFDCSTGKNLAVCPASAHSGIFELVSNLIDNIFSLDTMIDLLAVPSTLPSYETSIVAVLRESHTVTIA